MKPRFTLAEHRLAHFVQPEKPDFKAESPGKKSVPLTKEGVAQGIAARKERGQDGIDKAAKRAEQPILKGERFGDKPRGPIDPKTNKELPHPEAINPETGKKVGLPVVDDESKDRTREEEDMDRTDGNRAGAAAIGININSAEANAAAAARSESNNTNTNINRTGDNKINISLNTVPKGPEPLTEAEDLDELRQAYNRYKLAFDNKPANQSLYNFKSAQLVTLNAELKAARSQWRLEDNPKTDGLSPYRLQERTSLTNLSKSQLNFIKTCYTYFRSNPNAKKDMQAAIVLKNEQLVERGITDRHFARVEGFDVPFMSEGPAIAAPEKEVRRRAQPTTQIGAKTKKPGSTDVAKK